MNSKEFLLDALDAQVEHKKRAYKTFSGARGFVDKLPENHLAFLVISRQSSIKKQAEEIMRFLWLAEQQSSKNSSETGYAVSS